MKLPTVSYRSYLLLLLSVIVVFNYVDRLALGLLLQDMKLDLRLTDTQLGFLTGIAFALFYAVMGIPIARWADRGNRSTIISLTAVAWSVAVALCGAAMTFSQLLLIRICVAVGESGCHPPAFSLIADYFSAAERPRAISRYLLGWSFALLIGYFFSGWFNEIYGWRLTFVAIGAPGVLLGILAKLTLREPRCTTNPILAVTTAPKLPAFNTVIRTLWANSSYRRLLLCLVLSYFFGNGILQWQPAFFVRSFGMTTGELGTWLAAIYGIGGLIGTYIGGELASRYAANNQRLQLIVIAGLFVLLSVLSTGVYLPKSQYASFAFLVFFAVMGAIINGPIFAASQALVQPSMRAISIAIVFFVCNLIGMGLGPLAVGKVSDMLVVWAGEDSLRYALLAMSPGYLVAAWYAWRASSTVIRDLDALDCDEQLRPLEVAAASADQVYIKLG